MVKGLGRLNGIDAGTRVAYDARAANCGNSAGTVGVVA